MKFGHKTSSVLLKNGWRTDSIWTKNFFFQTPLKYVAIWADTRALLRSQFWGQAELETLQLQRIKRLLAQASKIPFWADRFRNSGIKLESVRKFSDFSLIPILKKTDLFAVDSFGYCTGLTKEKRKKTCTIEHTSGSTGVPFYFYLDRHFILRSYGVCERMFLAAGSGKRYPVVFMRGRWYVGIIAHWFYMRSCNVIKYRTKALLEYLKKFTKGFLLYAVSSYIVELASIASEQKLNISPRAVIASGEGLLESSRAFIEKTFGCRVFSPYITRELGRLAFECENGKLHVNSEWAFIEITDDAGNALPYGREGRIVVTTFDNEVMPFIRYDTGDRGMLYATGSCECGRTLPCIKFTGRQTEIIRLQDRTISAMDLVTVFDHLPRAIRKFQFIQTQEHAFTAVVVPSFDFHRHQEKLTEKLRRMLGAAVKIEWKIVSDIPAESSGKRPLFKPLQGDVSSKTS